MVNGGTSCWVKGPDNLDCRELQQLAKQHGILIELGDIAFADPQQGKNYFRLGFTAIDEQRISQGVAKIGEIIKQLCD
ncbi:hypothetical protein [Thalassotalea maritima]|uniref:hypothetical protein n=1 Tax=Thalassotalea maritima TaxID=3242416 RepID=UPI003529B291